MSPVGPPDIDSDVPPFVLGSYSLALAIAVAAVDVDRELVPMSLHASFLRDGVGADPFDVTVESLSDGRRLARREVRYRQGDRAVLFLCRDLPSASHSRRIAAHRARLRQARDVETIDDVPPCTRHGGPPHQIARYQAVRGDRVPILDPVSQWSPDQQPLASSCCAGVGLGLLHLSAMQLHGGGSFAHALPRTLEHSMWFHAPTDPSAWMLVDMNPISLRNERFLGQGTIHAENGEHVANIHASRPRHTPLDPPDLPVRMGGSTAVVVVTGTFGSDTR